MTQAARGNLRSAIVTRARLTLEEVNRWRAFRAVALLANRILVEIGLAAVRAAPEVEAVYLRGSQARGDSEPLVSDLDLAILVREGSAGPLYASTRRFLRRLRWVKRSNPLIRDSWQLVLADWEAPLIERYGRLLGVDDWRAGLGGRRPALTSGPVPEELLLASAWNRQHMWTESALRHVLSANPRDATAAHGFVAAEKKALHYERRLAGRPPPRRRSGSPRSREQWMRRTAALVGSLDSTARSVASRCGVAAATDEVVPPGSPAASSSPMLEEVARRFDIEATFSTIFTHGWVDVFVVPTLPAEEAVSALLDRLSEVSAVTGKPCSLYSQASFALACLVGETEVYHVCSRPPGRRRTEPLLLRQQLLYEALHLGAELRILADRPVPAEGPPLCTVKLARALVYFKEGRIVRGAAEALAAAGEIEPDIRPLPGDRRSRQEAWFGVNALLWRRLVRSLVRD